MRSKSAKKLLNAASAVATILGLFFVGFSIILQTQQIHDQVAVVRYNNSIAFSNYFQEAYKFYILSSTEEYVSVRFAEERINEGLWLLRSGIESNLVDLEFSCAIIKVAIGFLENRGRMPPSLPEKCVE